MASAADYFMKVGDPGTATNLAAPGYTVGDTSITGESTTNWPTDTGCIFAIDVAEVVDGKEVRKDNTLSIFAGVVSGATTITDLDFLVGTPQNYDPGAQTRVYILISSQHTNRLIEGILQFADQEGNLLKSAIQESLGLGTDDLAGWNPLAYTPNTVTYNGNRSYSLVFNSQDLRSVLSRGTRLRTSRTSPAPDKCTSLNGTSQNWSKASPVGMSFTDDAAIGVWVKLTSYTGAVGTIVSRYNGTSGWSLQLNAKGQVELVGRNAGSANYSQVQSYQSLPLNRWVHIAAQLDMSGFTATSTTSYIMLDGVDVPVAVTRGGTNPTALIQAGNLEVGSQNGGLLPFAGKIAQLAIFGAKVAQATIIGYMSQALAGNESGVISAFSFNSSTNDLNANANHLTAAGSAVATDTDSPFGNQGNAEISNTFDYGIVADISFSTNTTVIVQVPEGNAIPTTGGVSAVAYSGAQTPYNFPSSRRKWMLYTHQRETFESYTTIGSYLNIGALQIMLPVGAWKLDLEMCFRHYSAAVLPCGYYFGLSTSPTAAAGEVDLGYIYKDKIFETREIVKRTAYVTMTAATPHYLIAQATSANTSGFGNTAAASPTELIADFAYL